MQKCLCRRKYVPLYQKTLWTRVQLAEAEVHFLLGGVSTPCRQMGYVCPRNMPFWQHKYILAAGGVPDVQRFAHHLSSPIFCPLPSAPFCPLCPPQLSPLSINVTALPVFSQFIVNSEGLAGFSSTLHCLLHRDVKQNMKRASRLKHTEVAGIPAWPHDACSLIATFSQFFPQEPHQLK